MDWDGEAVVLERIVALLLALACLAERASCMPCALRLPVLALLGRGEAVARAFVMASGAPGRSAAASLPAGRSGSLAARFRALAILLGAMLAAARRGAHLFGRGIGFLMPPLMAGYRDRPAALPAPDTS